ncbi:unnamed protein product [Rhizophagus irregularis]|nr:unnamed protein product [Rhizophagus irregularis]CAB5383636.1 unnamed protein product [Rhizophagus irregularis]
MLCLNKYCKNLCQDTFQVGFNDVVTSNWSSRLNGIELEKCNQTPQEDDDNYISDNIRPIKKSKTTSTTSKQKATQDIEAIITNLTTNGARNYNNVVLHFQMAVVLEHGNNR